MPKNFRQLSVDEKRLLIWHYYKLGLGPVAIHDNICAAHGEHAIALSTVSRWLQELKSGNEDLKDKPRSGRPQAISDEAIENELINNPSFSTEELANIFKVIMKLIHLFTYEILTV